MALRTGNWTPQGGHNCYIAVQGKAEKEVPLAKWDLVYRRNPPPHKVVPKGLNSHMLGAEWLLSVAPQDK